jgi:DNA processing protein
MRIEDETQDTTERAPDEAGSPTPDGARVLSLGSAEYPRLLAELPEAPPALFVQGRLVPEDALAVAIVGSRRATEHGRRLTERLAFDLAARGVTVVSGLARGIDSAAHEGALRAGGRTVAVLGSGLDVIYPRENRRLATRVTQMGALVSQFPPGTPPLGHHFPARNRVMAGLALGVVVVEAEERSGSLITAGAAGEFGREVMAVPGRALAPESRGTHRLIKDGAALVEAWDDVVAALPERWRRCVRPVAVASPGQEDDAAVPTGAPGGEAERLLGLIGDGSVTVEEMIERSGMPSGRAAALLLGLELTGRVRQLPGKRFVRAGGR